MVSEPTSKWRYHAGVIYVTFVSDGTTGAEWILRLEKKGIILNFYTKSILSSDDFKPTKGVSYEIVILPGGMWDDKNRTTKKIRLEADKRNFSKPNVEASCFIREMFSGEEIETMGLKLIFTMHEPIKEGQLSVDYDGESACLTAYHDRSGYRWPRGYGFAFVSSQAVL